MEHVLLRVSSPRIPRALGPSLVELVCKNWRRHPLGMIGLQLEVIHNCRRIVWCTHQRHKHGLLFRRVRYQGRLWSQLARMACLIRLALKPSVYWGKHLAWYHYLPFLAQPSELICLQGNSRLPISWFYSSPILTQRHFLWNIRKISEPICRAWRRLVRTTRSDWHSGGWGTARDSDSCSYHVCRAKRSSPLILEGRGGGRQHSWRFWFSRAWCEKLSCDQP